MRLFILLTAIAALPGLKLLPKGQFQNGLSRDNTFAVYGIFSLIILVSHASYSYDLPLLLTFFPKTAYFFDQLTVVPFFLFSGYGIALSVDNKPNYAMQIPINKMSKTYLHFAISNVLFILTAMLAGDRIPTSTYALSFLGLKKPMISRLGNCSWFVMILLCLYFFVFLSRLIFGENKKAITAMTAVLCILLTVMLAYLKTASFYWNTVLMFPLGMIFYSFRDLPKTLFAKKRALFPVIFAVCIAVTVLAERLYRKTAKNFIFILATFGLAFCIILFLSKVQLTNRFFIFCGKHAFELYILQGIPMKLLERCEVHINPKIYEKCALLRPLFFNGTKISPYLYITAAILMSIPLAALFRLMTDKLDHAIFSPRKADRK